MTSLINSVARFAIIGYGLSGRHFHAPYIQANARLELTGIVTSSSKRALASREECPTAVVYKNVDDLFESRALFDAVVIATNVDSHLSLALRAIEAGKHVVIDKPVALTAADVEAIAKAAAHAGVIFCAYQNRRWDADFVALRKLIKDGRLGDVLRFESAFEWHGPALENKWRDIAPRSSGGGVIYELGPHLVDQSIHLFGPALSVHAELDARRKGAIAEDEAFVSLVHQGRVRSRLWMSQMSRVPRPRFRVEGTIGIFESAGMDPQERQLLSGMTPNQEGFGIDPSWHGVLTTSAGVSTVEYSAGNYRGFYESLVLALADEGPLPVEQTDSIETLRIIEQCS